jgi:hypothetical protein
VSKRKPLQRRWRSGVHVFSEELGIELKTRGSANMEAPPWRNKFRRLLGSYPPLLQEVQEVDFLNVPDGNYYRAVTTESKYRV